MAEIVLGFTSTTDDAEGELTVVNKDIKPTVDDLSKVLANFIGITKQKPPIYSAVKLKGVPAYKLARRGKDIQLKPKTVEIMDIKLLDYSYPVIKIKVTTGSGVYIRSLARDIGEKLCTGAYIKSLIRTRVGDYTLDEAMC